MPRSPSAVNCLCDYWYKIKAEPTLLSSIITLNYQSLKISTKITQSHFIQINPNLFNKITMLLTCILVVIITLLLQQEIYFRLWFTKHFVTSFCKKEKENFMPRKCFVESIEEFPRVLGTKEKCLSQNVVTRKVFYVMS